MQRLSPAGYTYIAEEKAAALYARLESHFIGGKNIETAHENPLLNLTRHIFYLFLAENMILS